MGSAGTGGQSLASSSSPVAAFLARDSASSWLLPTTSSTSHQRPGQVPCEAVLVRGQAPP